MLYASWPVEHAADQTRRDDVPGLSARISGTTCWVRAVNGATSRYQDVSFVVSASTTRSYSCWRGTARRVRT
jgi:hypothetical protein